MRLPTKFKNWLFNTPGVTDTGTLDAVVSQAMERVAAVKTAEQSVGVAETVAVISRLRAGAEGREWTDPELVEYLFAASLAASNTLAMTPFGTQLLATANMLRGTVVEMDTGEGKTLVGAMVAAAHVLAGRRAHVLTVNDYLAKRDAAWMGPFFAQLGVSVAAVTASGERVAESENRQDAYRADVVYVSVNELGFDVLRDRTITAPGQAVLQPFDACIVDEIDSVLVDEAVVPLVLAGPAREELQSVDVDGLVRTLRPDIDYTVEADRRNVSLTDSGINRAQERWPGVELYSAEGTPLFSSINVALHAHVLLQRDIDYIVRDGRAQIISDSRGRVALTQRWPDGLQAAVETKEGLRQTEQGEVLDQLLIRDLIKSFATVTGMSGTAVAVAEYLRDNYALDAGRVPANKPSIRQDLPEQIYATRAQRDDAVLDAVTQAHATGRPVLLGTHDVATSEKFAARLAARNVQSQVLNARNDALEADIIAQAGRKNAVTVSTQMAGRGTDILLGGTGATGAQHSEVAALGGLLVIVVGRFPSPRLDAQLKGRAGRQGDPGAAVIFASMEDPAAEGQQALGLELGESVAADTDDAGLLARAGVSPLLDRAQRMAEEERFTLQSNSWKYNELIAYQRKVVLAERDKVLGEDAAAAAPYLDSSAANSAAKMAELRNAVGEAGTVGVCRHVMLFELDAHWSDHLALLAEQRAAIHLRALGRQNPLDEFRRETINAFEGFLERVAESARATLEGLTVTAEGVDLQTSALIRPSSTWTYVATEDPFGSQSDQVVKWLLKKMGR
ncbi:accessory Sec system translocase SecA2 [Arthrobacter alpinus]|uniref:accessory Sec system translocase SecA2 n=1 Tax=Arthrobacter alpinus TaxID=656366 RepID=UPI00164719CB|nr:accessory Sec system translocase SecA2 [Arthrobacter alpinus]